MRDWKDRLGIFASAACAVHCAATPVLVAILPTLKFTEWMADPSFHQIVAVICCGLVAFAILPSAFRMRDIRLLSFASSGLGLIVTAAFLLPDSCCSHDGCSIDTTASFSSSHSDHGHPDHGHPVASQDTTETAETSTPLMAGIGLAQPWMTPLGGLLLIVAHGLNMRRRWKSECSDPNCCTAGLTGALVKVPESSSGEATLARAS